MRKCLLSENKCLMILLLNHSICEKFLNDDVSSAISYKGNEMFLRVNAFIRLSGVRRVCKKAIMNSRPVYRLRSTWKKIPTPWNNKISSQRTHSVLQHTILYLLYIVGMQPPLNKSQFIYRFAPPIYKLVTIFFSVINM